MQKLGVFSMGESFEIDDSPLAIVPTSSDNSQNGIDFESGIDLFEDGIDIENGINIEGGIDIEGGFDFEQSLQVQTEVDYSGTPLKTQEVTLDNPDDKDWQDEVIAITPQPRVRKESSYAMEVQSRLSTSSSNNPIYLGDTYETTGELIIDAVHLRSFYDNALHLDRKDTKTYITLVAVNNYCFMYALNIGIQLTAFFGCTYPNSVPMVVTLPINKMLKLINTNEPVTLTVEDDEFFFKKTKLNVSLGKPDAMYTKECDNAISEMYMYYDMPCHDQLDNTELKSVLNILAPYARMNQADNRLIMLDSNVAYVKSTGYYVFQNFKTNHKYLINNTLSQLLNKLCDLGNLEEYPIRIIVTDDTYVILANNYMLKFPILNGDFKFNLIGKIQPTAVYSIDKREFKTALEQIDLYTEKKCAIVLGETSSVQNKTVQGTAYVEISLEKLEDSREDQSPSVYEFDYNKMLRVLGPLKTDNMVIMECNTKEHLYLTDQKMTHYIILSVK